MAKDPRRKGGDGRAAVVTSAPGSQWWRLLGTGSAAPGEGASSAEPRAWLSPTPTPQLQAAVAKAGTRRLQRNAARPISPIQYRLVLGYCFAPSTSRRAAGGPTDTASCRASGRLHHHQGPGHAFASLVGGPKLLRVSTVPYLRASPADGLSMTPTRSECKSIPPTSVVHRHIFHRGSYCTYVAYLYSILTLVSCAKPLNRYMLAFPESL